jgi:hypothetical protein
LKQDRKLSGLKASSRKSFDANVELFQSTCKATSPHCELCIERGILYIELILLILQVIYTFALYFTVYFTAPLADIWARLYVNRRRAKSILENNKDFAQ